MDFQSVLPEKRYELKRELTKFLAFRQWNRDDILCDDGMENTHSYIEIPDRHV